MNLPLAPSPGAIGLSSTKLQALLDRVKRDTDNGTLPSAQVAIARQGKLAAFEAYGTACSAGKAAPATRDTLYCLFSATKAVAGVATWALIEDGLLKIEEKVADIIPEFGTNGKDIVTVEQTMLHIAGFPTAPMGPKEWGSRESRLAMMSRWRLNWEPGTQFAYHATSAHWVLMEIVERRTGVDYRKYIRERLLDPLGLDNLYIGLPESENGRCADVEYREPPDAPTLAAPEVTTEAILRFNLPEVRAVGVPGGGGMANAGSMALFYDMLANGGMGWNGRRVLKPETIEYATTPRTDGRHVDMIYGKPVNRALTVIVAGDDGNAHLRGMGRTVSPRAFGHNGAGGQIAWCDPTSGISLAYLTDGFLGMENTARKTVAIGSLAGDLLA